MNALLTDDEELQSNMKSLVKGAQIKESQLLNWHLKGPEPLRYLMGHLLLSNIHIFREEIKKISPQVVKKIITMIDKAVGAKIFKKNTGLLKARSKIMKETLGIPILD